MRRGFLLIWGLVTAAVAALVGVFSYQAGWAAGLATRLPQGAAGAAGAPYWYYGPHFGFGFFGLIPLLLFILLLALVFRAGWRRGPWGWGGGGGTPPYEERLQEWHRRAHGGEQPPAGTATG
jgi:hypothetical protein